MKARNILLIAILLIVAPFYTKAQQSDAALTKYMNAFHYELTQKNVEFVKKAVADTAHYRHSNGWVESKTEMIDHITTGYIQYHTFNVSDVKITNDGPRSVVNFNASIDVTLQNRRNTYELNVTETWIKNGDNFQMIAREAKKK